MSDVVVVGAGIIGASCAYFATLAGLSVTVLERDSVASGTTSRGEGNVLVSDKPVGPELDLVQCSRRLWLEIAGEVGADSLELEHKGGLTVAPTDHDLSALRTFADDQRAHGVEAVDIPGTRLRDHEPHLSDELAGGVLYPGDLQVQPARAAAALLSAARSRGAELRAGADVTELERAGGRVTGARAGGRTYSAGAVVNATGTWGGTVAASFGTPVPVRPRRGFVLVTEPLPRLVRHKVYGADYVGHVLSSSAGLQTSLVVEGTRAGTVLIGASRERVGFEAALSVEVVRALAAQAVRYFPVLSGLRLLRVYHGFRPYCPDHLPVIGADPRAPGLYHACGHEGGGIGLGPVTGRLVTDLLTGAEPVIDPMPFSPARFKEAAA